MADPIGTLPESVVDTDGAATRAHRIVSAAIRARFTLPATIDADIEAVAVSATLRLLATPSDGMTMETVLSTTRQWSATAGPVAGTLTGIELDALKSAGCVDVQPEADVFTVDVPADGAAQFRPRWATK